MARVTGVYGLLAALVAVPVVLLLLRRGEATLQRLLILGVALGNLPFALYLCRPSWSSTFAGPSGSAACRRDRGIRLATSIPGGHMDAAELARVDRPEHEHDHVREVTGDAVNQELDRAAQERLAEYHEAAPEVIDGRIDELRREWDMERVLELNASALALTGVTLAAALDRRFLAIPAIVLPFLMLHAVRGWCPPVPLFRRMGVRTQREIDREIVALKTLRGDFDDVRRQPSSEHPAQTARAAWEAARV